MAEQLCFMAIHAHPDDEVFSTGGVFAQYAQEGIHTVLVTCTGGEEGEIVDPEMNVEEIKPRLAEVRARELECAVAALGGWPVRRATRSPPASIWQTPMRRPGGWSA